MGTILKPEEMAERMKTISDNIRTIMEIRPIKAPRYSDIIEKAKDRIDAKMEEIGKTGIKRNRTPDNTPQNHNKNPKNTPQGSQTPEYQTDVTFQTAQSANCRARKRKSAENEQYNEEARENKGERKKAKDNKYNASKKNSSIHGERQNKQKQKDHPQKQKKTPKKKKKKKKS